MFFDKYKSSYSLNFFAVCGWINFIGCLSFAYDYIFSAKDTQDFILTSAFSLSWFFAVYITVTFLIFILERFYEQKITNHKILNDKNIHMLRILGFIFAAIPFCMLFLAFIFLKF